MPKNNELTEEDFNALLRWFSVNQEEAGAKYEEIREGLIRYFYFKGCSEAENLADETINRLAKKLSTLDKNNNYKHITYFYGFAAKVYLEYRNKIEKKQVEFEQNFHSNFEKSDQSNEIIENKHQCLDGCLAKLLPDERKLAIQYFSKDKSAKFEHRRKLAEELNLKVGTMHVKLFRLKAVLRNCVENCLNEL